MKAILTVDVVLLTLVDAELHAALFKRENEPFQGRWALPGGYIHETEDDNAKAAAYYEQIFLHDWNNVARQSVK